MKTTMLTFMVCLVFPKSSTVESRELQTIPLSMMDQSVDDMYFNCNEKMNEKVKGEYFPREMNNISFQRAWKMAESCVKRKFENRTDQALTEDHLQAICVYTEERPNVYDPFNTAVRNSATNYSTPSFQYHALHFWLTSAIQILNANKSCQITYRRSKLTFTGNVNQEIRFGSFPSSSNKTDLKRFGNETCFHIKTCLGGYLKDYPKLRDHEEEVLIPPYEKFKITKIETGSDPDLKFEDLKDCKTIFFLESAGVLSNLNCKAI